VYRQTNDLYISDGCNANNDSSTNFPTPQANNKIINSELSSINFAGAANKNFGCWSMKCSE
jgi:hypothetical protein